LRLRFGQCSFPPDFRPGWTPPVPPRIRRADLFNPIGRRSDLYLEFGFVRLQVQSYVQGGAGARELYEMVIRRRPRHFSDKAAGNALAEFPSESRSRPDDCSEGAVPFEDIEF
jgi:hypothetical protein